VSADVGALIREDPEPVRQAVRIVHDTLGGGWFMPQVVIARLLRHPRLMHDLAVYAESEALDRMVALVARLDVASLSGLSADEADELIDVLTDLRDRVDRRAQRQAAEAQP
jgi:hypothetical protein